MGAATTSRNDIRQQKIFQSRNPVLQHQLAFFQTLDVQLIERAHRLKTDNLGIEIAVFRHQPRELLAQVGISVCYCHAFLDWDVPAQPPRPRSPQPAECRAKRFMLQEVNKALETIPAWAAGSGQQLLITLCFDPQSRSCRRWTVCRIRVRLQASSTHRTERQMSLSTHLVELSQKHQQLEKMIREEQSRPKSDDSKIRRWKHEKLKLKDAIVRHQSGTRH
jgi:hypothetical protein